ncbi:ferritin-like domain-containing protein [Mucilaginibacter hurinus]|uniref:Ferritin-like domain-containing protein n=1 Tax=Mucilaginibacter hurinus TaxID=2201324 RepID=A0A367GK92_9SPHI|nr:ferritin-like domain-containing protein [Mucilaginibacter hurinus]RCH53897.1 ferritin-like domain-containing protein [Mucilaginibacter hurinus]
MNLFNIIEEIEKVDPEVSERISPRRAAIKNITSFGSKVAAASLPFAFGSLFKKAYAQSSPSEVIGVLDFALTLEYLEAEFYKAGLAATGLGMPAADRTNYFEKISRDENAHVTFLQSTITALGGQFTPKSALKFDFTGGGAFGNVMSNYETFLKVSVAFEDTGVRAYKGQAPKLLGNEVVLGAALAIHAVEARHASAVRYVLNDKLGLGLRPWIVSTGSKGNDTGVAGVDGNYNGEQEIMQLGINITDLPNTGNSKTIQSATASFDEPLTKDQVLALLIPAFIKPA